MQVEFGDPFVNVSYGYYFNHFHLLEKKIMAAKTENRKVNVPTV